MNRTTLAYNHHPLSAGTILISSFVQRITMDNITVFGCNHFNFYNSLVILIGLIITLELISKLDHSFCSPSPNSFKRIIEIEDIQAPIRTFRRQPSFVFIHNQLFYFNKKVGWKLVNPKVRKQLKF